jgi:hypothetical protein
MVHRMRPKVQGNRVRLLSPVRRRFCLLFKVHRPSEEIWPTPTHSAP